MIRTKAIREAVIELNFSKIEHELANQALTPELPLELLAIIKQTGCLLLQRSDAIKEQRRDQFIASMRQWFAKDGGGGAGERFLAHCKHANLCEDAFRAILLSLAASPSGRVSSAISAWAAILATAADMIAVRRALSENPPPIIGGEYFFASAESLRVPALGRPDLDPDAAAEHYAYNLGGYLKMLAYVHGWFNQGSLVIPCEVPVPSDLANDRSALYLAECWNQLEEHWARIKYFEGSSVRSESRSFNIGDGDRLITTLVFEHEWQYFLEIDVARARLRQQVFEVGVYVLSSPKTAGRLHDPREQEVEVFPRGLISVYEAASTLVLDMCYGLPLNNDNTQYLGLKLAEWLRGYALLQFCCDKGVALEQVRGGVCYLKMDAFLDLAQNAGLPRERALSFVKHATFHKHSRDLFDTPLIQTADGRHIIFSSLFTQCALHEAVTSRINSLLLQVDRKDPGFEREARESFAQLGGIPKRIEYRNKEGKFECDAAVLWNNALLLVECKAYTLPQTSASDLFFFRLRQEEAADQIRRIARHIAEDPSIIERAFGRNLDGLHVTLCVLNLAPFSAPGENRDVKFYDHGALSKFCEGAIKVVIRGPKQRTEDPIAETVLGRLWVGAVPTPDDLLRQMDQPFQYLNESGKWDVEEFLVALSNDLMMLSPFLRRRPDRLTDLPELRKSIAGGR